MKTQYHLKCLAPDGDMVTEGRDFDSIESAWRRADEMGSRWIFFPFCVVTTAGGIIRSVPEHAPSEWLGRNVKTMAKRFAENSEAVAEYCNGESQLCVWP